MSNRTPPPPLPANPYALTAAGPAEPLLQVLDITKSYQMGPIRLQVLRGVSLSLNQGEFVAIMGASGSGKSTLLHIAGALDRPDSGRVFYRGQSLEDAGRWGRASLRNNAFGFIFQFYHLLPELNVLENVLLPAMVKTPIWKGTAIRSGRLLPRWLTASFEAYLEPPYRRKEAIALLTDLGLEARLKHRPNQLSGGERQRVAIARALINQPALLLADEPTGNLDAATGRSIMDVLLRQHKERRQSILLVTHDPQIAALADRTIRLDDGRIIK